MLLTHEVERARSRAWAKTGKRMAARMAMIAITTSSSMSVNARRHLTGWPVISALLGFGCAPAVRGSLVISMLRPGQSGLLQAIRLNLAFVVETCLAT